MSGQGAAKYFMAEAKFELPPLSEEQIREIRERSVTPVDSHALAAKFMEQRTPRPDHWAAAIEERHGFDPRRTLTELEGHDAGDGTAIADEAETHALRRVPLSYWTPADTGLMLNYGQGTGHAVWLALELLNDEPMREAEHYPGDLLITTARVVACPRVAATPEGRRSRAALGQVFERAEPDIWSAFEANARELELSSEETDGERERLRRGMPSVERDRFRAIANLLNRLAEARSLVDPPTLLRRTEVEMVYARYRPRRGLEMVPRRDLDDPAVMAHLEAPDTFWFRRATRFEIIDAGPRGVRLRHFSESAIENWHGRALPTVEDAVAFAREKYGIGNAAWAAA